MTSGFLYGKNLADDDLVLEMAGKPGAGTDAGMVRCAQNRSTGRKASLCCTTAFPPMWALPPRGRT